MLIGNRIGGLLLVVGLAAALLIGLAGCFPPGVYIDGCDDMSFPGTWFGYAPLTICMSGARSGPGGVLWHWDFGDGTTATGPEVTHTFIEIGDYEVRLTVTFTDGSRDSDAEIVSVAGEPVASFTAQPGNPSFMQTWFGWLPWVRPAEDADEENLRMHFDGSASLPSPTANSKHEMVSMVWDFGDGTQETELITTVHGGLLWFGGDLARQMKVDHEYAVAGTYDVTLTVTDNLGVVDTRTRTITVGTPGDELDDEPDGADDDLSEAFTVVTSFWEVTDEEDDPEHECVTVWGTVRNDGAVDAGCELTATAYDASKNLIGTATDWPMAAGNITAGTTFPFAFLHCTLTVPPEQVARVEVEVTDARVQ